MRYLLAVWIGKIASFAIKMLRRGGTAAPGKLAIKICPDILKISAQKLKKNGGKIIAVMGTNGKTTTNNLLANFLEEEGYEIVANRKGANMPVGMVTAFLEKTSIFGKIRGEYASIETDEAWARHAFPSLMPDIVVLGNLFRDQLDRYGEVKLTMGLVREAFEIIPDALLIINADDPVVTATVQGLPNKIKYFGIENAFRDNTDKPKEGQFCYICGKKLNYEFRHFSQLGKYNCECGFCRPEISFNAKNITSFPEISFEIEGYGNVRINGRGVYNIYNILGASAGALSAGVSIDAIKRGAEKYKPQSGRLEEFKINGKSVFIILSKNPAGFNQSVGAVLEDPREKDVLISINDFHADGKDVSWLWDVDFGALEKSGKVSSYSVSGTRYGDMGLRLKYEDVTLNKISLFAESKNAVKSALEGNCDAVYMLVNYTALNGVRDAVKEIQKSEN